MMQYQPIVKGVKEHISDPTGIISSYQLIIFGLFGTELS